MVAMWIYELRGTYRGHIRQLKDGRVCVVDGCERLVETYLKDKLHEENKIMSTEKQ